MERYARQHILKGFGPVGQQRLQRGGVLVVGAGGLGCPALQYLAAAGVGRIGIIDDDVVNLSNLQRQVLYTEGDIGKPKAVVAREKLLSLNSSLEVNAYPVRLTTANTMDLLRGYDIIMDGTDNFATRYMINDACIFLNKPLVFGAVSRFEGQVAVFNAHVPGLGYSANYRDLFKQPPKDGEVLSCAEAGVLGVLPGIIGTLQANEVVKLLAGIGKPLINQVLTYNVLYNSFYTLTLTGSKDYLDEMPASIDAFRQTNYGWECDMDFGNEEIDAGAFADKLGKPGIAIVDVRNPEEEPRPADFSFLQIPLAVIRAGKEAIEEDEIIFFCQTGKRSLEAVRIMENRYGGAKKVHSLRGGILAYLDCQATQEL